MKLDSSQQVLLNLIYHYLGVTGRPALPGELRTLADGFGQRFKGRPLIELLQKDQRFLCLQEQWGLTSWKAYTALDVESTGLSPVENRITEIALVRLWGTHVVEKWSSLVNPCCPIPPYIVHLIGIDDEMVSAAPIFRDLIPTIRNFIGTSTLLAHNASFDRNFISAELSRAGEGPLNNGWQDTLAMAKKLLPHLPNRKLVTIAEHFGVSTANHHRAMADALMVAGIYDKMTTMEESLQISG